MFASWRRPSRILKRQRGLANDKSSLAVDDIRSSGGTSESCVPQEPSPGPLLAVAERIGQISYPVVVADQPRQLPGVDARCEEGSYAGSHERDGANRATV